jgi:hypothetical protein
MNRKCILFFIMQVLVIGAGVTLYEALKAADQLAAQVPEHKGAANNGGEGWRDKTGK